MMRRYKCMLLEYLVHNKYDYKSAYRATVRVCRISRKTCSIRQPRSITISRGATREKCPFFNHCSQLCGFVSPRHHHSQKQKRKLERKKESTRTRENPIHPQTQLAVESLFCFVFSMRCFSFTLQQQQIWLIHILPEGCEE